ncbi:putative hydrolases of HD superfamily [Pseudorhodobacter antarcticus]|uniref:5'-deoxynucleotidase n=1 Tax=Pseudorhodobacter antarcticus TaxID=1077947 RepID=A0A1H8BHV5_9RHOB|nr:HD domain-containing protein [Pseudorhodobacter antarcticus]SEM82403.1 putative hydrolases of HD superfamily [Pseudorhodobacter antarcticus]
MLDAQFAFLNTADRLKSVLRANDLLDGTRPENSAEHSWHVALWALVFAHDAPNGADIPRAITMLLLHDLVEIDAGDHPIHLPNPGQSLAEARAAKRLFGLLPPALTTLTSDLWAEFEAGVTPTARYAKQIDHAQPMFQALCAATPRPDHVQIVRDNLATGRARDMATRWPAAHAAALMRLDNIRPEPSDFERTLDFLNQADQLKSVNRATTLCDGSRFENSAEHSWHIALYALILADQAGANVDIAHVIQMLLLHDLVEIDVGDVPIHSAGGTAHSSADTLAAEAIAAKRIFSLFPNPLGDTLHALWQEFEGNQTPSAQFAKSLDRVQPVMQNIQSGGGSWIEYNVTFAQLESRVGDKIARGAPQLWPYIRARALPFFK